MRRPSARALVLTALFLASSIGVHAGLFVGAGAATTPADASLVDEANRAMALRATATMDLGSFFLRAERGPDTPLLARWAERKVELAAIGTDGRLPHRDRVEWILAELFRHDALGAYVRDSSTMARFFDGPDRGGNCEAETKLVVSAIQASGIDLTGEYTLGVQVFDDHVQPVLVDARDRTVVGLVDGRREEKVLAPIFDPAILLHAYVAGLGRAPSVSAEALLLFAPGGRHPKRAAAGYATDTKLRFPPAGVRHTAGEAPPRATLTAPRLLREGEPDDVFRTNVLPGPFSPLEDVVERARCPVFAAGLIRVRDPDDAAEFNRLGSYEARARFIVDRATRAMKARAVPADSLVETLRTRPVAVLERDLDAVHTVLDVAACGREAIEALGIALTVYRKEPYAGLSGALRDLALELGELDDSKTARWRLEELQKFAADRPRELARLVSSLPHPVRVDLLTLLGPTSSLDRVLLPLARAVALDERRADVPAEVRRLPEPLITFDVEDPSDAVVLVPAPPPTPPEAAPPPSAAVSRDERGRPIGVSAEAYVDIVAFALGRRPEARLRDKGVGALLRRARDEAERRDLLRERRELAYRQALFAAGPD